MPGTDATTSRTSLRCASARDGTSPRDAHRAALLLDHCKGLPPAPVGQPVHSMAPGNIFWRRHARAGPGGIVLAHLARAKTTFAIRGLGGRALAGASGCEISTNTFCHSERSEESLFLFMGVNLREILRFAQNDKINSSAA